MLQDAARLMAESQSACKEVWAPGYDHTPELSDSEDQTGDFHDTANILKVPNARIAVH